MERNWQLGPACETAAGPHGIERSIRIGDVHGNCDSHVGYLINFKPFDEVFIVRAANAHNPLLSACKRFVAAMRQGTGVSQTLHDADRAILLAETGSDKLQGTNQ